MRARPCNRRHSWRHSQRHSRRCSRRHTPECNRQRNRPCNRRNLRPTTPHRPPAGRIWADTVFQHQTTDHGFPSRSVTALAQDGDGFLWVGTQGGLLRWDGYRVRRYEADAKSTGALHDNFIQRLYTDPRGTLWIGTSTAGLARYDRDNDRIVSYPVGAGG